MAFINEKDVKLRQPIQRIDLSRFPRGGFITDPEKVQALIANRGFLDRVLGTPGPLPSMRAGSGLPEPFMGKPAAPPMVRLPEHYAIPGDGQFFDKHGSVSVAIGGAETTVASFTVPDGKEGFLKFFGQDAESVSAWADLTWYLKVNNTSFETYGNITRQMGTITEMTEVLKYLNEGDIVKLSVSNGGSAAHAVYGRIKGWTFIRRME